NEDHKESLKEVIGGISKEKVREEVEILRKKLEESDVQLQENTQQLNNQLGTSSSSQQQLVTNNKGKDRENKDHIAISVDKPTKSADERTPLNQDFKAQIEIPPKSND